MFYSRRLKEHGGSVRVVVAAEATTNPAAVKTALASMAGAVADMNAQAAAATAPAVASNTPASAECASGGLTAPAADGAMIDTRSSGSGGREGSLDRT